ncbi:YSC84-related protein [Thalassospira lucentensis]|uniref:Twin-arginine translocation pathway signal protein n=1 Tax=Thalassospira lucentensis TaxID=168935 RepID=A0A358HPK2_9PROT|nr:YSC84-related protein [Thalassospira lucentensis]HBU97103.1 twin-arginine translocation pathway signal protein [Thalassospira lucentensis]HCW65939.1 twin-arginine translocation pathway signal protein [Thalassospira lucentensis]|tara:strand:- start:5182 stop:5748 length:567 start_codon:yes stop_codon:yes gene_type:complete
MTNIRKILIALVLTGATALPLSIATAPVAQAASVEELNTESNQSLQKLYDTNPLAKQLSEDAKAILVFPSIIKAGLVFGGAYGEGVLLEDGKIDKYYNSVSASWGLQVGAQSFGYAVFLMTDKAINYLNESKGWEIGVGPTVVVMDEGAAKNLSSSTLKDDAYAFIFDQEGLMVSVSIEGTKITRIKQ